MAVLIMVIVALAGLTVFGWSKRESPLTYRPTIEGPVRHFLDDPRLVMDAFCRACGRGGLSVIDRTANSLLVDLRPTPSIMAGGFGMTLRLVFESDGGSGTRVHIDARPKVPFPGSSAPVTLVHTERAMRMRAKQAAALQEVL